MADKVRVIKRDALVNIEFGTEYYKRVQELVMYLIKDLTPEQIQDGLKQIEKQDIKDAWAYHYETLLIFASAYENIVLAKDLFEEVDPTS